MRENRKSEGGIACQSCGDTFRSVISTRFGNGYIRRRCVCACGIRYTTYETNETMKVNDGGAVGIVALAHVLEQLDEFRASVEAQLSRLERVGQ